MMPVEPPSYDNQKMSTDIAIPLRDEIIPGCKLLLYHVLEASPHTPLQQRII